MTDYTTLSLVKAALNITKTSEDTMLSARITAASAAIDLYCGREFGAAGAAATRTIGTGGRVWRNRDGDHLLVDDIGSTDGLVVEVGTPGSDAWTDVTSRVEALPLDALDRGRPVTELLLTSGWWRPRARITAAWGWPSTPAAVGEAALLQTIRLYKRKDSAGGVLDSPEWGAPVRLPRLDPDVAMLITPYRLPGVG